MKTLGATLASPLEPAIHEEPGRLLVGRVAPDISHGVVDMPVYHEKVQKTVQIHVEEKTCKTQTAPRDPPDLRADQR